MGDNLPPYKIVEFIISDFASAWDALAHLPGPLGRGNFMFGKQAMVLLEVACRLCASDATGGALVDFGKALQAREPRYFTKLPGHCWSEPRRRGELPQFRLPSITDTPSHELLAALFDTIRNGQAHQYQQIAVQLTDGKSFQVSLTGAEHGAYLAHLRKTLPHSRPVQHLQVERDQHEDIWVTVLPPVLFLDIQASMELARLLGRGLTLKHLSRGEVGVRKKKGGQEPGYLFSGEDLCGALLFGGHCEGG